MMEFEYVNEIRKSLNEIKRSLSVMEWIRLTDLISPLEGIHLTEAQVKTLSWIASCEPETIDNLIAIFLKLRIEGR